MNWCSFLKNSPETFRSEIYFGAFFGSFAFEKCFSKSPKVFRIVLQCFENRSSVKPSSKGHSRGCMSTA